VQYTAFDPDTTSFVSQDQKTAYTAHDPAKARKLLKQAGIIDDDGDGVRELANGERFTLQIRFSSQGVSAELVELVADDWSNVGVKTTVKEVTIDEYRSAQSANELDVHVWKKGEPLSVLLSNSQTLVPPYGSFFGLRNGMLWARYMQTDGEEGLQPPKSVDQMQKMINEFQTLAPGSERSNELGHKIVDKVVEDLYFIGVAKTQNPIYAHNTLENFKWPKLWGYPYYWSFAYRPTQWSLAE
jgi:peptide/nickel transport system substrate-binding protein